MNFKMEPSFAPYQETIERKEFSYVSPYEKESRETVVKNMISTNHKYRQFMIRGSQTIKEINKKKYENA